MAGVNLGIDFGGSSIKAGLVDLAQGAIVGEMLSVPTPVPSTPHAVVEAIRGIDARLPGAAGVGFGFPSVVKQGRACTASNSCAISPRPLPVTASVISEAEATEMTQPWPSKRTSRMRSPSRFTYTVSRSPHSGLWPSALVSAGASAPKLRGCRL